jgi:hypothetical protein
VSQDNWNNNPEPWEVSEQHIIRCTSENGDMRQTGQDSIWKQGRGLNSGGPSLSRVRQNIVLLPSSKNADQINYNQLIMPMQPLTARGPFNVRKKAKKKK